MQARSLASPRFGLLLGVCTSLGACAKTASIASADTRCIERCESPEGLEGCFIACFEGACGAPSWREPCVPSESAKVAEWPPTPMEFGLVSRFSFGSCEPRPADPAQIDRPVDPAPR